MGNIETIFTELVAMLKVLPTGGYANMSLAVDRAKLQQQPSGKFNCDKSAFKDTVTLAEHGLHLVTQTSPPPTSQPDVVLATMLASVQVVKAKVDSLMLESANRSAKRDPPAPKPLSFAQAARQGMKTLDHPKQKQTQASGKTPKAPPPPKLPQITLAQSSHERASFVELDSKALALKERIDSSLRAALLAHHPTGAPPTHLCAIVQSRFTGEIHLQFHSQEVVDLVAVLPTMAWVCAINPYLCLKVEILPIIVHGIPTSFNPDNLTHIQKLMDENVGVLDTLQRVVWANQKSLDGKKTHSSLIIHLTDLKAANYAIHNWVLYARPVPTVLESTPSKIATAGTSLSCSETTQPTPPPAPSVGNISMKHPANPNTSKKDPPMSEHTRLHEQPDEAMVNVLQLNTHHSSAVTHSLLNDMNRQANKRGIYINKRIPTSAYTQVETGSNCIAAVEVRIDLLKTASNLTPPLTLALISAYAPLKQVSKLDALPPLLKNSPTHQVLVGMDSNLHHPLWNPLNYLNVH
ncbi:hypothetical protein CROQUDRAFT_93261 [Cronartium quercuum f. sp. fusiforme G11]|uniref:Endonuclease/exonuclease/phosphatase domain-containing protein n=1 Tax=Cronartium quercuum f. sp. fusiforme G11 TaxID=708437 RepID=A0A9P6NH66_9BASI|nr:hypothetical protein CROQUDRAFT_93261 [Cronartium quercuum f. sp. fusiforme G11]